MSSSTAPTQLRRRAALARLEAEELADAVSELRVASLSKSELERVLERVEVLSARVQKALDLPGGLSVSQAAERLEVSEPTVRKWLSEGLLERVEDHKPVEIAQRSVIEVERVLDTVRESYPARRWSEALAAFLHDRDLLGQEWVREGVEQLRHGELIER
ncbi:MAG: sigma factor-like helix-turn-helix DNA-binding protein [Solirubrobacterales bacterium]